MFIRHVTLSEVYCTLKSMPKEKSKGPDGLNVEFYIFFFIGKWLEIFCLNPSLIFFQTTTIPNS